jgi:hypothetical protein
MEQKVTPLGKIPAWVLSLILFVISILIIVALEHVRMLKDVSVPGNSTLGIIVSIFFVVIIPIACFIICYIHPKSVRYTPLICNPVGFLGTIFHPLAWTTLSDYLFWVGSLALSILGAIIGAKIGRRRTNQKG